MNVHMEFTFPDREETDLEKLNNFLSLRNWTSVTLEDFNGFQATTRKMNPNSGSVCSVTHWYGFDRIVLDCALEDGKQGHRYQVETQYLTQDQAVSTMQYRNSWLEAHPDSILRTLSCVSFQDGGTAFVVLFHEKGENTVKKARKWVLDTEFAEHYQTQRESCTMGSYAGEPIDWLVLEKNEDRALLISKYGLTLRAFNEDTWDTSWEECSLREWLNTDFYQEAFLPQEQESILPSHIPLENSPYFEGEQGNPVQDKVFLLSIPEAERYFVDNEDRICLPGRDVDVSRMAFDLEDGGKGCYWWLRSMGIGDSHPTMVQGNGNTHWAGSYSEHDRYAVRPAMWVRLK